MIRGICLSIPGDALQNGPETWFTPWRRTVGFPSFGFAHEHALMPWKETRTVDQRLQFLSSYLKEEMSVTDLCHEYGISRPTAYKWIKRYDEVGLAQQDSELSISAIISDAASEQQWRY